jgi:cytochrome c1
MNKTKNIIFTLIISHLIFGVVIADEVNAAEVKGKQEFMDNCSLCHGENAKGHGVFAEMLIIPTADLTQLSKNNDGHLPYKALYSIIDGRDDIKQHGPRYMPIWGDRYQSTTWFAVDKGHAETLVRGTIFELLLYLDSIQE